MKDKFLSVVKSPMTLLIVWIIFASTPFIPMIGRLMQNSPLIEIPVFIVLFKVIQKTFIWFFLFINLYIVYVWYKETVLSTKKIAVTFISLLLILAFTVSYSMFVSYLISVDLGKYPNYLFSTFGIMPELLRLATVLNFLIMAAVVALLVSIFERFVGSYENKLQSIKAGKKSNKLKLASLITTFSLVLFLTQALYPFFNIPKFVVESKQGYGERLGEDYTYIQAIAELTPKNSYVIHPPQGSEWPFVGNQPMIRYFLFPRTLVSGVLLVDETVIDISEEFYFVSIDPRTNVSVWPLIDNVNNEISFDHVNPVKYTKVEMVGEYGGKNVYKVIFK